MPCASRCPPSGQDAPEYTYLFRLLIAHFFEGQFVLSEWRREGPESQGIDRGPAAGRQGRAPEGVVGAGAPGRVRSSKAGTGRSSTSRFVAVPIPPLLVGLDRASLLEPLSIQAGAGWTTANGYEEISSRGTL